MKNLLPASLLLVCAALLCSCGASTSVKETWISESWSGEPIDVVAVLAVTERGMIRVGLENRFANVMEKTGNKTVRTHELLGLREIEEDQKAAGALVADKGARSVLITHLISADKDMRSVRAGDEVHVPVTTGFNPGYPYAPYHGGYGYGWGGYYSIAFRDMSTVWSSQTDRIYLETSLFDLDSEEPIWSCVTKTVLTEDADYLIEMDRLADLVVGGLRKDGLLK